MRAIHEKLRGTCREDTEAGNTDRSPGNEAHQELMCIPCEPEEEMLLYEEGTRSEEGDMDMQEVDDFLGPCDL